MKRFLIVCALLLAVPGWAGDFLNFPNFPTRGQGPFDKGGVWWNDSSLTFYAPFDSPSDPLRLIKGTGTLSFTRATTATYVPVNSTTGYIETADINELRIIEFGALIEGQRTNLVLQGENLGTTWTLTRATVSVNQDVAPDGMVTADRIISDNTAANNHYVAQSFSVLTDNTNYIYCSFLKPGAGTYSTWAEILFVTKNAAFKFSYVNLVTGEIGNTSAGFTVTSTPYGNGWYRYCGYTNISSGAQTPLIRVVMAEGNNDENFSGDNTSYILSWGIQLEAASSPSSYIPTATAAVTRNLDQVSFATASNIDNAAGTVAAQWSPIFDNNMTTGAAYYFFDAGGLEAYYNATDRKIYLTDGTNTVSTAALTFTAGQSMDLAFTWGAAGLSITVDGTDTTGATYTEAALGENTFIGSDSTPANSIYGNEKNVRAWSRQFTVAERKAIAP